MAKDSGLFGTIDPLKKSKNTEGSTIMGLWNAKEKLGPNPDKRDWNTCRLFYECGQELRFKAMPALPTDEEGKALIREGVKVGHCYNTAYQAARQLTEFGLNPVVWLGYIDCYDLDTYAGSWVHSFVTFRDKDGEENLFDPLVMKYALTPNSRERIYNHCGVPLPSGFIEQAHQERELLGLPGWANYLYHHILSSDERTKALINKIHAEYGLGIWFEHFTKQTVTEA